ncbi:MAG: hypothetical protein LBT48_08840 [Prevotellaceae bacterium]|jgi:hypothetical protein|nr:hypothetical protein [Prevotellaceae bacterium]
MKTTVFFGMACSVLLMVNACSKEKEEEKPKIIKLTVSPELIWAETTGGRLHRRHKL